MAALFLLLAIVGGVVVGDLVMENTAAADVTVFNRTIGGYSQGVALAVAAALGFLIGLALVGAVGLRRSRRERRRELRESERELTGELRELEAENDRLREALARRDRPGRRVAGPPPDERHPGEPLYDEARRAARLRAEPDPAFAAYDDRLRAPRPADERSGRSSP